MIDLKGKKVIVTGGCRGIGKSIVKKFLENGAIVATTYNSSYDSAANMKDEFKEYEENLNVYKLDVTEYENVSLVIDQIEKKFGNIDVLVNNAGMIKDNLLYSMSISDWDKVIKTNLYGPFYTCKSVLLNMIRQKSGSIINIASVSGLIGVAGQSNYCASKFGVIGLTKALAKEVASKNVRVNAIAPGYVDTQMINKVKTIDELSKNKYSMRRVGKPEEIANVAMFLASELSSYITGQVIVADGCSV